MIRNAIRPLCHVAFAALCLTPALLSADTIKLKGGRVLTGKVLEDRGDKVLVEMRVGSGIRDQREVAKSDILEVIKEEPGAKEFVELEEIFPTPDLLEAADYERLLKKVERYRRRYPESSRLTEVDGIAQNLEKEKRRLEAGQIKLGGEWLSAEEQKANAYDLEALRLYSQMKEAAERDQYRAVMISYQELVEEVPASSYAKEAASLAQEVLQKYRALVLRQIADAPRLLKERERGLKNLEPSVAREVKHEMERKEQQYRKAYELAKGNRSPWIPTTPYHEKELKELLRNLERAAQQLSSGRDADKTGAGRAYREAYFAITQDRDFKAAQEAVRAFASQSSVDLFKERLNAELNHLESALAQEAAAQKATEEAQVLEAAEAMEAAREEDEMESVEEEAQEVEKAQEEDPIQDATTTSAALAKSEEDYESRRVFGGKKDAAAEKPATSSEPEEVRSGVHPAVVSIAVVAMVGLIILLSTGGKKKG